MRLFIENNFGAFLILSVILGLCFPSFAALPSWIIILCLSVIIFFACSKVKKEELKHVKLGQVSKFYVLRFVLLPMVLFGAASLVVPQYSLAILLLALMPAGVNTSVVSSIYGGNVFLGLSLTILSTFLTPITLPLIFSLLGKDVNIDLWGISRTSGVMILVPIALYWGLARRFERVKTTMRINAKIVSVIGISIVCVVAVSKQRDVFLNETAFMLSGAAIMFSMFAILYVAGYLLAHHLAYPERTSYTFASGVMNSSLAIGLSVMYFPSPVPALMVISKVAWVLCIPVAGALLKKFKEA